MGMMVITMIIIKILTIMPIITLVFTRALTIIPNAWWYSYMVLQLDPQTNPGVEDLQK